MRAVFGLKVEPSKVLEALEEAKAALEAGVPLVRALPKPGEDYRAWSRAEKRTARLLAAYLQGKLSLEEVPLEVGLRLEELREDLDLGAWVLRVQKVLQHLRKGAGPNPDPREAAQAVLQGKAVPVEDPRDLEYLEEVARALEALERRRALEEKVARLLTAREDARVTPEDKAVVFGRLRAGKPVWVKASPEELEALRKEAVKRLSQSRRDFLSPAYRYTRAEDRAHPRILHALKALWAWVKGEAEEAGTVQGEAPRAWAHRAFAEDYEVEVLHLLGVEADWTDPDEVRAAVRPYLENPREAIPETLYVGDLSLAAQEAVGADAYTGEADRRGLYLLLKRVHRRTLGRRDRRAEGPHRAVAQVLSRLSLAPQKEVRERHRKVLSGDKRHLWWVAAQALPAALEVLLEFPALWDEMVPLAWEWAVRAAEGQRSLHHHPGAYAARLARLEAPYYAELRRQAFGLSKESLKALQAVRKVLAKNPGATPEEVAKKTRQPVEWVQEVAPLVRSALHLDERVGESEDLYLRDTVEGGEEPSEAVERASLRRLVDEALERLEAAHGSFVREVVERTLCGALPLEEFAEEYGVEVSVLEDAVALGRNFLREDPALRQAWEEVEA